MIPNFDDNRINFVRFIKENKDIFDELLNTSKSNRGDIREGYYFFKNFNLNDDADAYALTDDLDDFDTEGETKTKTIISKFEKWLRTDRVRTLFEEKYNKKLQSEEKKTKALKKKPLEQIEEIGAKRRTMKRTSRVRDELSLIDYVPDDRENAVKGKTYRITRDRYNNKNNIGGKKKNKTKHGLKN